AALESPWDRPEDDSMRSLVQSVTSWLRPDPCAVREGNKGTQNARNLRVRFSRPQRVAIARFLGLVLVDPVFAGTIYAYGASQSIAWCWVDDPATTLAATALRAEARTYARPPVQHAGGEDLCRAIERAFEHTPAPESPLMTALDEEPSEYAIEFAGTRWQGLAPWFLDFHSPAFSYMTPASFRYFLPAALCHALGPGTDVDLTFHLVHSVLDPSPYRDELRAKVGGFSTEERLVVTDYIRGALRRRSSGSRLHERAIVEVWDPDTGV
ncbi:MAG: hypothetical protein AB8H79_07465, partial [Myxococcota bacterium]